MKMYTGFFFFVLFIFTLTSDSRAQWVPFGPDSGEVLTCLFFDNSTSTLFAGSAEGFWYNQLASNYWTRREDVGWIGRSVYGIASHQSMPGRVVTGRVNAFFKGYIEYSDDWGVTNNYVYSSQGGNVTDVKSVPGQPDIFYACTWPDISPGELVKSTDGGVNWTLLSNYIHYAMTELVIDLNNPNTIYVSGDEQITKSTDGGVTWVEVSNGLPSTLGVYCVTISPSNSQVLLCSNDNGIYRTTDAGVNWSMVYNRTCRHIEYNPVNPNYVCAVTFTPFSILLSTDAGASWSDYTGNYAGGTLVDLAFSSDGTKLFAASADNGVYVNNFTFVPVELTSFTASLIDNSVILNWTTATETNNKGFEVERKTERDSWTTLDFVKGNGTSTSLSSYSFSDNNIEGINGTVSYRLRQIDYDGSFEYSNIVEVTVLPKEFSLEQNYPNPFNPSTVIEFNLDRNSHTTLTIFDALGNQMAVLLNEDKPAGNYKIKINAGDLNLNSGVYFYRITAGKFSDTKKFILMK